MTCIRVVPFFCFCGIAYPLGGGNCVSITASRELYLTSYLLSFLIKIVSYEIHAIYIYIYNDYSYLFSRTLNTVKVNI